MDTTDRDEQLDARVHERLGNLPRELDPERDLLPEIAARAWRSSAATPAAEAPQLGLLAWWRSSRTGRVQLAAAAIVLILISSLLTALTLDALRPGASPLARSGEPAEMAGPEAARPVGYSIEADYMQAIDELLGVLERRRETLPPEARRLVEGNLQTIDEALREARAALEAAPDDPGLQQAVAATYEQKLSFLRQAAALTVETRL